MAQTLQNTLPAQSAAGADSTTIIGEVTTVAGTDNSVSRIELVPPPGFTTVTGAATNNAQVTVNRNRAGASVALGQLVLTSGNNLVAETPITVPLTGTAANLSSLQQNDLIEVVLHQNGTGLAVGAGVFVEVELA